MTIHLQYLSIYRELITNFLLALAAVAFLSYLVLGKIEIAIIVTSTVVRQYTFMPSL